MEHLNVRLLLTKVSKNGRWVSYTFLQSSFKFYNILEQNCAVHINNEAIKRKIFVDKCFKERSLGELYFPTKTKFLQVYSILEENYGADIINRLV